MALKVEALDHLVLTVRNVGATVDFYTRVLGMRLEVFGEGRKALKFGSQKINLHQAGAEFEPKAEHPLPGSADLCFLTDADIEHWKHHLGGCGVTIEEGPVPRTGATGPLTSIYLRDPDGNLIEVSTPG